MKKKKKIVWHKKSGKFVPSSALKAHSGEKPDQGNVSEKTKDKLKKFKQDLSLKIKKASQDSD